MGYLNQNIRYLRKEKGFTQEILANRIGVKRSLIGSYEENRSEPKIPTIQRLAQLFAVSIDDLINVDLSKGASAIPIDISGQTLRILPISVDTSNKERISVVPEKAKAGYTEHYADPEYIGELPSFSLPINELYQDQTYRLFQISGDSMLPIPSGSYIIATYLSDWQNVKDGACYIVVTRDQGIVYKRLWNRIDEGQLLLKSDNTLFEPYTIGATDIIELWKAVGYIGFELPNTEYIPPFDHQQMQKSLSEIKADVGDIKKIIERQ